MDQSEAKPQSFHFHCGRFSNFKFVRLSPFSDEVCCTAAGDVLGKVGNFLFKGFFSLKLHTNSNIFNGLQESYFANLKAENNLNFFSTNPAIHWRN